MNILMTAMDKIRLGLPQRPLEDSPAKRRLATVEVGRAVAIALTPGMPPIENLSIKPRGGVMGRILFQPQVIIIQHSSTTFKCTWQTLLEQAVRYVKAVSTKCSDSFFRQFWASTCIRNVDLNVDHQHTSGHHVMIQHFPGDCHWKLCLASITNNCA